MPYETRNLDSIVNVTVQISPQAAPRATFNQLLVIGTSEIIPAAERLRLYENADDLLTDGFENNSMEYEAALLYFSQSPQPDKLWVGRQDLTAQPAETPLSAAQACRAENHQWYVLVVLAATDVDNQAIAAWAQAANPATLFGYTSDDPLIIDAGSSADIMSALKGLGYSRTIGQYSTISDKAIVAILGYAMGKNTGLINSAFTLKFKQEIGIQTEALSATVINTILGKNGNIYLNYADYYNIFQEGKMANGFFFDRMINLDMLVSNIQLTVMDLLYGRPKIPQTDSGVTAIIHAVSQPLDNAVDIGYLASGVWDGPDVLNLHSGDMMPRGYVVQAQPIAQQSRADRDARKSPPIYVAIHEAGAIHSVLIGVYVQ
jgi:hypothetical protein